MATNDYHFITHWRVEGTMKEIGDILIDGPALVRWWPSVYLEVAQLSPGDERGVGKVINLCTKGWLPYTLSWQFVITEITPIGFTIQASGAFNGCGMWTFGQNGDYVDVIYDWKIRADKALLRDYSFIMKPIFSANHHWAMCKGEESLKLEFARRRARTPEELAIIPAPPPVSQPEKVMFLYSLAAVFVLWLLFRLNRRR